MRAKFTTKLIESAKPKKGQRTDYWDSDLRRLGLRVSTSGRKVWIVMYRRASDGKKRRYTLGTFPLMSLGEARQSALEVLTKVEKGDDPATEKEAFKADGCFSELADDYIERYAKPNLSPETSPHSRRRLAPAEHFLPPLPCAGQPSHRPQRLG